jgi:hypothetical protein
VAVGITRSPIAFSGKTNGGARKNLTALFLVRQWRWRSYQAESLRADHRVFHTVEFGRHTEENLVVIDLKDFQTDVALNYELFAHAQLMVLHGGPPRGQDELAR